MNPTFPYLKVKAAHNDCISTEEVIEVDVQVYRGFAIKKFVIVSRFFEPNEDYCPDPDNWGTGIPGHWELIVREYFRAVRCKNGVEFARGSSVHETCQNIDNNLGTRAFAIPF